MMRKRDAPRIVVRVQDRIVVSLLAMTLLPITLIAFIAIRVMTARLEAEVTHQADGSLRLVQALIDATQRELLGLDRALADDSGLQADLQLDNLDGVETTLRRRIAPSQIDRAAVFDPQGNVITQSAPGAPGDSLERIGGMEQPQSRVEVAGRGVAVTALCPIRLRDGSTAGVLKLVRAVDQALVDQIHAVSGAEVTVYRQDHLLVSTFQGERATSLARQWQPLAASVHRALDVSDGPVSRDVVVTGEPFVTRNIPLARRDGHVAAGLMVALSRQPTRLAQSLITHTIFVVMLVAMVVVVVAGTMLARAITRPIRLLVRAATAMARGELRQRVRLQSTDELGDLAAAFNKMAMELQALLQKERELAIALTTAEAEKRKTEELQRYATELAQSNAELQQFAYVASHDLQEPLRIVASYIQLLSRRYKGQLSQEADEFIGFSVEGVVRMQRLINDLLAYSRVGTHGRSFAPVNCAQILERALANMRASIEETHATVTYDPLPTVMGDGTQLVQLFQNLLSNALKFRGSESPRVHVGAQRDGQEWRFSVRDHGIGIEPAYHERIFVIFQRLSRTHPGTGIGLAICRKIVERHNGRMWVESQLGQGATFYFTLSASTSEAGAPPPAASSSRV